MYRKTSGNPLIMRALGILAGALTAAEAASPILPSGFVRWLLLAVIFVLGGVLFAVIQYAPAAYYQGKWPLAGLAAACAAALLAMAQLGEGVLVMLLVIACEVLIGVLTLHGGRRTAFGDEIVAQALGYRKFLRRVTQSQLQSRLAQDSQYFLPHPSVCRGDGPRQEPCPDARRHGAGAVRLVPGRQACAAHGGRLLFQPARGALSDGDVHPKLMHT